MFWGHSKSKDQSYPKIPKKPDKIKNVTGSVKPSGRNLASRQFSNNPKIKWIEQLSDRELIKKINESIEKGELTLAERVELAKRGLDYKLPKDVENLAEDWWLSVSEGGLTTDIMSSADVFPSGNDDYMEGDPISFDEFNTDEKLRLINYQGGRDGMIQKLIDEDRIDLAKKYDPDIEDDY